MRKNDFIIWLLGIFALIPFSYAEAKEINVQNDQTLTKAMERANSGDVIILEKGIYHGPFSVSKSVTLKGEEGAKLQGVDTGHVLILKAEGITIENLLIEGGGTQNAGVYVKSNKATIRNNEIKNVFHGIQTTPSYGHIIENNVISSFVDDGNKHKGYGIYINEAEQIRVLNNRISYVQDGIYNSFSDFNEIVGNQIQHARYGIHTMDSKNVVIAENEVMLSHIGSMIMQSRNLNLVKNLLHSNTTIDGVGMFIFDTFDSVISHNIVQDNHKGISMLNDLRNEVSFNEISMNNIGLELGEKATENNIYLNNFRKNIHQVVTDKTNKNTFELDNKGNYWDEQKHMDLDGDQLVDYSYRSGNAFYPLVEKEPMLQLFFESPAVQLWNMIEKYTHVPTEIFIVDSFPLEQPMKIMNEIEKSNIPQKEMGIESIESVIIFLTGFALIIVQFWITRRVFR